MKIPILKYEDVAEGTSKGFEVECGGQQLSGFVVLKDGQFFAYENKCPHTGAPLDWIEDQFLDADGAYIQCAVHDARFEIDSGRCVLGPCMGDCLKALSIDASKNGIFLME